MRSRWRGAGVAAAIAGAASAGALLMYSHTLGFGFDYDDYHFIRPYPVPELRAAFSGPWDPAGIEVPFYRPLTIAFYAARFELFGLDAEAHHSLSLALFALAAALAGAVAWQATRRAAVAVATATLFVVHPAMPYALVAWITNQMHLIETIVVLVALLWWHAVRAKPPAWWLPLLGLAAAAFMIKEDGVMLLPSIVALHWLRRRTVDPALQPVPMAFLAASGALLAALLWTRAAALEGLGGYGRPSLARAWTNYSGGLDRLYRLVPADRPWQPAASWLVTLVPLLAAATWRRMSGPVRYLFTSGAVLSLAFNLPFVFVTKNEQMHLVAAGAVFFLAGAAAAVADAARHWRPVVWLVLLGGAVPLALVARHISTDFAPFGPIVRSHDGMVKDWAAVPPELREYLARKLEPGAGRTVSPNPAEAVDSVAFGLGGPERSPDGVMYRWMSQPSIEIHVAPHVRRLDIPLRHEIGAFREPAQVRISVDGRMVDARRLDDGEWHLARVTMPPAVRSWTRRMHRVHVSIPRVWRPSEVVPGSTDTRPLGLQVGSIVAR